MGANHTMLESVAGANMLLPMRNFFKSQIGVIQCIHQAGNHMCMMRATLSVMSGSPGN
jgi:hypothetical protein